MPLGVQLFETLCNAFVLPGMDAEVVDIGHCDCRGAAQQSSGEIRAHCHSPERGTLRFCPDLHEPIQPAVARALVSRCPRLHIVLSVKMRPSVIRRADRMHYREILGIIERLEWSERRMQSKERIEDACSVLVVVPGLRDRYLGAVPVIALVAKRNDHGNAIHCAALKDGDDDGRVRASATAGLPERRPPQKRWSRRQAHHRESRRLEKESACYCHCYFSVP